MDGETIKISLPSLTQDRREELVKLVHSKLESAKIMVRQVRTDVKEEIEGHQGESGVSEDDIKNWLVTMQKIIEDYMARIEDMGKEKEKELMTL